MSNRTRNRSRRSRRQHSREVSMIDTDIIISSHEDPRSMDDYREHRERRPDHDRPADPVPCGDVADRDRLCEVLADRLARSEFADLVTTDGQRIGEEVLVGLGRDSKRQSARDLLADPRFIITLAGQPSPS